MSSSAFLPLEFHKVSLHFDQKTCLRDINFRLNSEGITVIMGANGSGKTLLLKLCATLLTPTQGKITWRSTPAPPQITLVPQQAVLLNRSVIDNIKLPLSYHQNGDPSQRSEQALDWANIAHLRERIANTLSTGEQQLVALARAWALQPGVLLLDELTANLDPARRQEIDSLIQQLSKSCKILMSTHSVKQARALATDILLLEDGKLLTHSNAESFFNSTAFKLFSGVH